jgi:hypothetical protein
LLLADGDRFAEGGFEVERLVGLASSVGALFGLGRSSIVESLLAGPSSMGGGLGGFGAGRFSDDSVLALVDS